MIETLNRLEDQLHTLLTVGLSAPGAMEPLTALADELEAVKLARLAEQVRAMVHAEGDEQRVSAIFRGREMVKQIRLRLRQPARVDLSTLRPVRGLPHVLIRPLESEAECQAAVDHPDAPLFGRLDAFQQLVEGKSLPELEPFLPYLCHGDYTEALGQRLAAFGEEAVPVLKGLLGWKNKMARRRAYDLLGEIGSEEAAQALVEALSDDDVVRRTRAALLRNGPRAAPALIAGLDHKKVEVQAQSARLLGELQVKEAIEPLQACLKREKKKQRHFPFQLALVRLGALPVKVAQGYANAKEPTARIEAKLTLVKMGELPAERLAEELSQPNAAVQSRAGEAIAELPNVRDVLADVIAQVKTGNANDRRKAMKRLARVPSPELAGFLMSADDEVTAEYLQGLQRHELIGSFLQRLKTPWSWPHFSALGEVGDSRALPLLLARVEEVARDVSLDKRYFNYYVKAYVQAFADMGEPAVELMALWLHDSNVRLADFARKVLQQIGTPRCKELLGETGASGKRGKKKQA
jgi:HEAT repeat protein